MVAISSTWRTKWTLVFAIKNNLYQISWFSNSRAAWNPRCSAMTRKKGSPMYHQEWMAFLSLPSRFHNRD
ncbi:unnamed protein product [Hymenolepis diminuta]|uniref:Uncharacterized protein n=1 Tax=Hymenolepis diminuta TaxID=6216 RepID=A0A564Z856_HYMDI|nr:unnamed protein product [Hymenolepis diminuta]